MRQRDPANELAPPDHVMESWLSDEAETDEAESDEAETWPSD